MALAQQQSAWRRVSSSVPPGSHSAQNKALFGGVRGEVYLDCPPEEIYFRLSLGPHHLSYFIL